MTVPYGSARIGQRTRAAGERRLAPEVASRCPPDLNGRQAAERPARAAACLSASAGRAAPPEAPADV